MLETTNFHRLFIESVNEENEKMNEKADSIFQLTSKNNLIAIAKENLKSKNNLKLKVKNPQMNSKVKLPKIKIKSKKKEKKNENVKNDFKFSEQEYLNFMLNDLKYISSSIKKKQNKYNPIYTNNSIYMKNRLSQDGKIKDKRKLNDFKRIKGSHNLKKHNYNDINLLDQIIGSKEVEKPSYENKITATEDNLSLNDFYFDKFTNQILQKNIMSNYS